MKRRPSRCWAWYVHAALMQALLAPLALAQDEASAEGATFLLRPLGARAVGLGGAVIARQDGSESVWWNPAALAALARREVTLHHAQDFFATTDALALILPSRLLGVIGFAAEVQDYGEQENTVGPDPPLGTTLSRSFIISGTYATTIGRILRSGLGFKVVQLRFDCTGSCDVPTSVAQTVALDAGLQADLGRRLTLGASVRNLGFPLQVEDSDQSDPLPKRMQFGAMYRYPLPDRLTDDAQLNVMADVIADLDLERPLPRVGAEFVWEGRAFLRGGYLFERAESEAGGPSLGLGLVSGSVQIDIARVFTGFSADAGQAPTFLSIRLQF